MHYRAKKSFIALHNEKETLVARGDRMFVIQHKTDEWKVFSFFSRNLIFIAANTDELYEKLAPEEEFKKSQRDGRFKGRQFGSGILLICLLLPFYGIAQSNPIAWSTRMVQIDEDVYEAQVSAIIEPGWWLYHPGSMNQCTGQMTSIEIIPNDDIEVMSPFVIQDFKWGDFDTICKLDRYYSKVVFIAPIKLKKLSTVVIIDLKYQPVSKYEVDSMQWISHYITIGSPRLKEGTIIRSIPKGIGRAWWALIHPFQRPYWKPQP